MATKLEWVRTQSGDWVSNRGVTGAACLIGVNDDGRFYVGNGKPSFPTLADAKAWCESQEQQPAATLPAQGSVWGVPDKPETWRKIIAVEKKFVRFGCFAHGTYIPSPEEWQSWVRESGAVDLIADRERLAKELEAAKARLAALEKQYQGCEDAVATHFEVSASAAKERDALRAAVSRLLEALRGIEHRCNLRPGLLYTVDNFQAMMGDIQRQAREAIKREEGGKP